MGRAGLEWTIDGQPVTDLMLLDKVAEIVRARGGLDSDPDYFGGSPEDVADALGHLRDVLARDGVPRPSVKTGFRPHEYVAHAEALLAKAAADLPPGEQDRLIARAQVLATLATATALRSKLDVDVRR